MSKHDKTNYLPYLADGHTRRCQATVIRGEAPRQCRSMAVTGFEVCTKHGAGTKARPGGGPPSPEAAKRWSTALPRHLGPRFAAALDDPGLLDYRPDIALLTARADELLGQLESRALALNELDSALDLLEAGMKAADPEAMMQGYRGIRAAANAEREIRGVWGEIRQLVQERKGLVQAEQARMMDAQMMISMDEMFAMLAQIRRAVLENVSDMSARVALALVFEQLANSPDMKPAHGNPQSPRLSFVS